MGRTLYFAIGQGVVITYKRVISMNIQPVALGIGIPFHEIPDLIQNNNNLRVGIKLVTIRQS